MSEEKMQTSSFENTAWFDGKKIIETMLIVLLSLFLQVHRQLCCDDCLDVVGLGQSFQLHVIVHHHKLMFQIGTGKGACLHFCDTACVHVAAKQRTKDNTDAAFSLATGADDQQHLLGFGGGDQAVAHIFLEGHNIHGAQELIEKIQPGFRLLTGPAIIDRQTVTADDLEVQKAVLEVHGAVCHMNDIRI